MAMKNDGKIVEELTVSSKLTSTQKSQKFAL